MKTNWKKYIGIIAAVGITALVIYKLASNKKTTESKVYHYDKTAPIEVKTITVSLLEAVSQYTFSGTFEANKEVKINADIQGKVNDVLVDLGSEVKKGQALVQLDNSLLQLQLKSVEVQIEGLENDVNRYKVLVEADAIQGVQLEKAELGLKSAKLQRSTLLEQISKTTIKAPFDGVITMKMTEAGAFAAPGVPLVQLTEIQQLRFTIFVSENDLHLFNVNKIVTVSTDTYNEISLEGKIVAVGSRSNPANGFPVQFLIKNTDENLIKAGMFGKAQLKNTENEKGLYISADLIQGGEETPSVYLVKDNKAVLQKITIAKRVQNKVLVTKGIQQGDVLVSKGFINLFDGANVEIRD